MNFSFFSPVKIIFGQGESENIFSIAADMGKKCLIVTGKNPDRCSFIFKGLEKSGIKYEIYSQKGEPAIEQAAVGAKKARRADVDFVIAIGGGSVIDASKAIAALVTNKRDIMEYLEVIGQGRAITKKPSPLIVLPTTSGTGAEVTCNAVLASQEHGVKVSMRSQMMYPDVAIVDPSLTQSMPKNVTAFTGMDALTSVQGCLPLSWRRM